MITSLHSPHIARVKALFDTHSPKERQVLGEFAIEGIRAIESAEAAGIFTINEIFVVEELSDLFPGASVVSEQVMKKMSETQSPQGVIALAKLIPNQERLRDPSKYQKIAYFLEVQDPGNAGTIIRSADALGFDAVLFSPGSVDPYSAKVVRSSVGSIAAIPVITDFSVEDLISYFSESHQLILLDMAGAELQSIDSEGALVLIFGNEARGIPDQLLNDERFSRFAISMAGRAESLNLATAAGIAMYEISRNAGRAESKL